MNETTKKIVLGGASAAILLGAFFGVVRPGNEKTKAIKAETAKLQATLDDLKAKEARRQEFLDGTAENLALFDEKLAEFPSNWNQEYQIEFVENVRKNPDIEYNVTGQGMVEPTAYYVLGGSGAETQVAEDGTTAIDSTADNYECYAQTMTLEYVGDYAGVKDFVDYVSAYPYRMTIDSVTIEASTDQVGFFKGEMTVNQYFITGKDREEQDEINLDEIETGVDNLFDGGSAQGSVSKYAADNGEAIISDYDLYVAVNPTTSDTSGKLVGLASGGKNVTSNKNAAEAVTISVSKDGDTYSVTYGIGTEKQTQEFAPGEDLTMLIQSSDLKDASDLNGVNISIENTTDKTLYVKIAGDSTARRVKIVNKAGNVIVYK